MRQAQAEVEAATFGRAAGGRPFQFSNVEAVAASRFKIGKGDGDFRRVDPPPQARQVVEEGRFLAVFEQESAVRAGVGEAGDEGAGGPQLQTPGEQAAHDSEGGDRTGAADRRKAGAGEACGSGEGGLRHATAQGAVEDVADLGGQVVAVEKACQVAGRQGGRP